MKGWLRVHLSKDITLLGWPGWRFWWAHLNYWVCYGREDYEFRKAWAKERHAKWIDEGYTLTVKRGFYGTFVNAVELKK